MADDDHRPSAALHRAENPIEHLSNADIHAVAKRLKDAAYALLAIHQLAVDGEEDGTGFYLVAMGELARSTFKGLDACIERLTGARPIGNFAVELDDDETATQ